MSDYEKEYEEMWKSIVENEDGTLNKDQIMRELSDFSMLIGNLSKIYCYISGNVCSKPNVSPEVVIGLFDEHLNTRYSEGYDDGHEQGYNEGICENEINEDTN